MRDGKLAKTNFDLQNLQVKNITTCKFMEKLQQFTIFKDNTRYAKGL